MLLDFFSAERLKRQLTIPEAACLWCDLPFTALSNMLDLPGKPYSMEYPRFNTALAALVEATDVMELATERNDDGYPVEVSLRTIQRDALKNWLERYHPDHRPALLFPHSAETVNELPQPQAPLEPRGSEGAKATAGPMLSTREVCDRFQISRGTLTKWLREQDFPAPLQPTPGASRRWPLNAIVVWVEAHRAEP